MYIFSDDEIGQRFHRALCEQAQAGRKVIVIYDRIGCFATPEGFWRSMRESSVFVYPYLANRFSGRGLWSWIRHSLRSIRQGFLRRNHRKTLIVDEQIAFTGGFNIMRECSRAQVGSARWLDTMYTTDRPVLVTAIGSYFQDSLRRIRGAQRDSGADFHGVRKRVREAILYPAHAARKLSKHFPRMRVQFGKKTFQSMRRRKRPRIAGYTRMSIPRALKKLMYHSQRRIWLTYPYFVPYGGVLRLLYRKSGGSRLSATGRTQESVDVRIYLSMVSDLPWMRDMAMLMGERLRRRGVTVYLFHGQENADMAPRFSHAKVALIDDWVGVGASNLDRRSMVLNLESLLLRNRTPIQQDVEDFFAYMERHSVLLDDTNQKQFRAGWRAYLLYPFRRWI